MNIRFLKNCSLGFVLALTIAPVTFAGPWTDASRVVAREAGGGEGADPAISVALAFVRACNGKRFDDAKALMTPEHVKWKDAVGGVQVYLNRFADVDLDELFMYRTVTIDDDRVRIDVKIHSSTRVKGENFRLNLIKTAGKWYLTHRNK